MAAVGYVAEGIRRTCAGGTAEELKEKIFPGPAHKSSFYALLILMEKKQPPIVLNISCFKLGAKPQYSYQDFLHFLSIFK